MLLSPTIIRSFLLCKHPRLSNMSDERGVQVANNTAIIAKRYTYVDSEIRLKTRGFESGDTRGPLSSKRTKRSRKKTNKRVRSSVGKCRRLSRRERARGPLQRPRLRVFARVIKRQDTVQWRTRQRAKASPRKMICPLNGYNRCYVLDIYLLWTNRRSRVMRDFYQNLSASDLQAIFIFVEYFYGK